MITEINSSYDNGIDYLQATNFCGLSTDTKPLNVGNGSTLHEIDTGKDYMFDAQGKTWYEQTSSGGGGEGGGDDGKAMYVTVTLTDDGQSVASVDRTMSEILNAVDSGILVMVKLISSYYDNDPLYIPMEYSSEGSGVCFTRLFRGQDWTAGSSVEIVHECVYCTDNGDGDEWGYEQNAYIFSYTTST